jgi:all-trans-retinol dehydrogenase (NAD+)
VSLSPIPSFACPVGVESFQLTVFPAAKAHFYTCDVTNSAALHVVGEEIRKAHGAPTVLINNAGIGRVNLILNETEENIRQVLDVNLISHFLTVKEFMPAMVDRNHGHIVTVASMASMVTPAQIVPYSCSKAACLAFHEGLSSELTNQHKATKVRTSIVHPTWARTAMLQSFMSGEKSKLFLLDPQTVSDAIVAQVLRGESRQIVLPARWGIMGIVRALPEWVGHWMRKDLAKGIQGSPTTA